MNEPQPTPSPRRSSRAEQARREIGRTRIAPAAAVALVALAGFAVAVPPAVQTALDLAAGRGPLPALAPLAEGVAAAAAAPTLPAANRALRTAIDDSETRLEEESWLRARLLPPTQRLLTGVLGLGNEQVVAGAGGWWYLEADFAHTTGRGFLAPEVLRRRWREEGVAADPVPAIAGLAADLGHRGIELLVVPVPAKSTVVPGPLSGRDVPAPIPNPSFPELIDRLAAAGVAVYDPTGDLLAAGAAGEAAFLRTDTHWTPRGLDRVAAGIASRLRAAGVGGRPGEYFRRRAAISGRGDLVSMLALPPESPAAAGERVEVEIVLTAAGDSWRPEPAAEVLLLGDSFTNVYSLPALGWGAGAGLAEQISFHLGAGVDRIARNAGGADRTRAELAAALAAGERRLAGKRVVVYQFAARELSGGDWRPIELPPPRLAWSGRGL